MRRQTAGAYRFYHHKSMFIQYISHYSLTLQLTRYSFSVARVKAVYNQR